jgi:TP901 family phage tail tape measure protein
MARNLKLEVVLQAIDRATKPIRAITQGSGSLSRALKATRETLKALNTQQRDIAGYKAQQTQLEETSQALKAARDQHGALSRALESQRASQQAVAAETKVHRAAVRNLQKALLSAKEPSAQLNQQYMLARDNLTRLETRYSASQAQMRRYKEQLRETAGTIQVLNGRNGEQSQQLGVLRTRLESAGISTDRLATHETELAAEITKANAAMDKQKARLAAITKQQERLGRARSQYDRTQQLAGSMAASGAGGLASGTGILYGLRTALAPGLEFDTTMSKVQALTNLDKGDEQLAAIRAQARKLGAETMFSATDAAQGQAFLAMAGFTPKNIMAAMPGLLDMAKAGDMDLGRTADIASNILGGFRLDASQMGTVADILTKAFTTSNMNLEMLGDTMKYVGPVAATAGMGLEEAAAMAGLLGNVGIQASQAGTTLRAMLSRLAAPEKKAAKAMEAIGIQTRDAHGNLRNITSVLGDVAKATEKMGSGERLEIFKHIFGEEPAAGMAELIEQAGAGGILKYLEVVQNHAGAAGRTAKVMADNLTGDLDELFSGLDEIRIELFDQQNGPLREFVQGLTEMVGRLGVWVKENPKLTAQILKTVAGLGILMATMGGITLTLASILGPFAMVRYGMTLLGIKSLGLVTGLKAVGGVLVWLGKLALANPIGLLITALVVGAYLIYKNWDGVKAYMLGLWAELKAGFSGGLGSIAATILNFSPLGLFHRALAGVLGYFGVDIPARFTDFGSMLIDGLVNGITAGLGRVKQAITGAAGATVDWFKQKLGIHSPSRVFAQLGGYTMAGLTQGLVKGEGSVLSQIAHTADQLSGGMLGAGGITFDRRPAITAGGRQPVSIAGDTISIHIHPAPGQDAQAIARAVAQELDKRERAKAARMRSALYDQE